MSHLPAACNVVGYLGYDKKPTETEWSKHVGQRLLTAGAFLECNAAGSAGNGIADTTLHTNQGIYFLEFKGENTPVRANQAAKACKYNAKSLYSRGELVSFVYKWPYTLGIIKRNKEILPLGDVGIDALSKPELFIELLHHVSQQVRKFTYTHQITTLIEAIGLPVLQKKDFLISGKIAISDTTLTTYTKELALKQCTGLDARSAMAMGIDVEELVKEE